MSQSMVGPLILLITLVLGPFFIIVWNRQRVKGKMLCFFLREDKTTLPKLCELRDSWVIHGSRAFDIYPDFVRLTKFPAGWPAFLQELVPCALYDEEDAIPLDWIHLDNRIERSMEVKAALDENWMRKLVEETAREGGGTKTNWRRILPFVIIGIGIVGLIALFVIRSQVPTGVTP